MSSIDLAKKIQHKHLEGGGEMGEITRAYDWSKSVLGTPDTWPQSLKTTISIILNSKFPMFLFWGPELICFYNDAYRPSLGNNGKHPAVGQRGEDLWPEIWKDIKPLIDRVLAGGEASWNEDLLLPIYRNGQLEDVYWTFSYSPVKDESGKPAGVFVTCTETTAMVVSLKNIKQSNEDLEFTLDAAELGAWDLDPMTNKFKGNNRLKEWFGLLPEDEIELTLAINAIAEKDRERVANAIQNTLQPSSGGNYNVEYTIKNSKTGEERIVKAKGKALFNDAGIAYRFNGTLEDITEQVQSRNELEHVTTTLKQAIETAQMGTWNVDILSGKLELSDQARIIHGIPKEADLEMMNALSLVAPEYRDKVQNGIQQAIQSGNSFEDEYIINPMDGRASVWLKATGKANYDESGRPVTVSGTMMDITERKRDEQRKNDFIGMVSHELKTPLTSLKAYIQLLGARAKKDEDDFGVTALGKADVQVNKMSAMINGFLNVTRLESGQIYLNKESFSINRLLNDIIDEVMIFTSSHSIVLIPCEEMIIHADRDKIGYVLTNLLSNAVKYSPRGQAIEVNCGIVDDMMQVSVKDEGMGIKPQDIHKLFDRYYRVENKHTQYISGFGIGLYLSSEIIKRHDGKIWAESRSGYGSTFYFTLPV